SGSLGPGGAPPTPTPEPESDDDTDPAQPTPTPGSLRPRPSDLRATHPDYDDPPAVATPEQPSVALCGRFSAELCAAYQHTATTGRPTRQILDLLASSSPARTLDRIRAPTLLIQGENDSLFPL